MTMTPTLEKHSFHTCDICCMSKSWLVLTAILPTTPSGLRVRVWRGLKATGAGALREGVYLLPERAPTAHALWALERTIVQSGAPAHLLVLQARDSDQETAFRALFDRSDAYAELLRAVEETRRAVAQLSEAMLRKRLRTLDKQLQAIVATDFFPDGRGNEVTGALTSLRRTVEVRFSASEPSSRQGDIAAHAPADYQRRQWATRARPGIDRLATAWLISRFVDREPRFVWLDDPSACPASAIGFDFDGATFTHVGEQVTFEVVTTAFRLTDPALRRLGALVHELDVGGAPVDEAPGIELLIRGLRARHADDDELLAAALPLFDALHTAWEGSQ